MLQNIERSSGGRRRKKWILSPCAINDDEESWRSFILCVYMFIFINIVCSWHHPCQRVVPARYVHIIIVRDNLFKYPFCGHPRVMLRVPSAVTVALVVVVVLSHNVMILQTNNPRHLYINWRCLCLEFKTHRSIVICATVQWLWSFLLFFRTR